MTTAQTALTDLVFAPHGHAAAGAAKPSLTSRLLALFARAGECFESYDDYFAEIERSLPAHVREQRRQRQDSNQVLLIAALSR